MSEKLLRNIDYSTASRFADQVTYQPGQVVSKTLVQNDHVSLTLFAFAKGEELGSHTSRGDALVLVLDGAAKITVSGVDHVVTAGDAIVMPANEPHALYAEEPFKMMLIQVFAP